MSDEKVPVFEHSDKVAAGMHIVLTVALRRLGVTEMRVNRAEYEAAVRGHEGIRMTFDGEHYVVRFHPPKPLDN